MAPSPVRCLSESFAESFAGADSEADAERRAALRRMKAVALSFLIGATVVFLLCRWANAHGTAPVWVGYVGAAAEAGMVGALAPAAGGGPAVFLTSGVCFPQPSTRSP